MMQGPPAGYVQYPYYPSSQYMPAPSLGPPPSAYGVRPQGGPPLSPQHPPGSVAAGGYYTPASAAPPAFAPSYPPNNNMQPYPNQYQSQGPSGSPPASSQSSSQPSSSSQQPSSSSSSSGAGRAGSFGSGAGGAGLQQQERLEAIKRDIRALMASPVLTRTYTRKEDLANEMCLIMFSTPFKASIYRYEEENVITLLGDIVVNEWGQEVKVPIEVYLPSAYPSVAPSIAIPQRPPAVRLKPNHPNVDKYGRVKHEYLSSWSSTSALSDFLQILSSTFLANCPIIPDNVSNNNVNISNIDAGMEAKYAPPSSSSSSHSNANNSVSSSSSSSSSSASSMISPTSARALQEAELDPETMDPAMRRRVLEQIVTIKANAEMTRQCAVFDKELEELSTSLEKATRSSASLAEDQTKARAADAELHTAVTDLDAQIAALTTWLNTHGQTVVDPEEAVTFGSALGDQLAQACAEDHAADATLVALSRLHQDGIVGLDDYLRHVRRIAREQFNSRALAAKIQGMLAANNGTSASSSISISSNNGGHHVPPPIPARSSSPSPHLGPASSPAGGGGFDPHAPTPPPRPSPYANLVSPAGNSSAVSGSGMWGARY